MGKSAIQNLVRSIPLRLVNTNLTRFRLVLAILTEFSRPALAVFLPSGLQRGAFCDILLPKGNIKYGKMEKTLCRAALLACLRK